MRTLDPLERKCGWAVGALPLVIAALLLPHVLHNTPGTAIKSLAKGAKCPVALTDKTCVVAVTYTPGHYALEFGLLVVLGAVITFAVWRSMRVLVAVASIFSGLATGLIGILSVLYGAWLLLRSWRLQRYGVMDGASVRKVAAERATERRDVKKATASAKVASSGPKPVDSSKRYTPKAKPRKR